MPTHPPTCPICGKINDPEYPEDYCQHHNSNKEEYRYGVSCWECKNMFPKNSEFICPKTNKKQLFLHHDICEYFEKDK